MAGQSIERRDMMRILALAAVASTFPGFRKWTFACEHGRPDNSNTGPGSGPYQPQFCSPDEYALVERLSELIIPTDDKPGAREAGVSEFIDFRVWTDPSVQQPFRYGLGWISAHGIRLYGKPFLQLDPEQQSEMLGHLAYKAQSRPGEEDGRHFFKLIRRLTVMGFYTSRIGLEQLDYPGLRTMWSEPAVQAGRKRKSSLSHARQTL